MFYCLCYLSVIILDSESQSMLIQLEDAAKAAGKGKWGPPEDVAAHVRDVKWQVDNTRHFVEANKNKEIDGICTSIQLIFMNILQSVNFLYFA